tara:strand:- start:7926 stop:8702 length:777 start_codon:yes stop_codon:yes gene_type:complete
MTTDVAVKASPALALKGGLFTLTSVQIFKLDLKAIEEALDDKIKQAPNFFLNTPVIIDLNSLEETTSDLMPIVALFKHKKLIPIGIKTFNSELKNLAIESGMAIMPVEKSRAAVLEQSSNAKAKSTASAPAAVVTPKIVGKPTEHTAELYCGRLISTPVRSGQQVYVAGGDLVVLNSVSQGAELLAEGNIHVHGPLRGRALAGVNGNKNTIIYCKSLEAELVSIAGQYRIIEDLKETDLWKRPVCIQLKDDRLQINAI